PRRPGQQPPEPRQVSEFASPAGPKAEPRTLGGGVGERHGQPVCRLGTQKPCYEVIYFRDASQRLNFEEARAACRRNGSQLVSIESEDEQRLIVKFIENLLASDGDFWIGLRRREDQQSNGTACQDLYAWIDGSTAAFRNWYVDEPSCGSEVCVVMYHQPSAPAGIGGPYMFQWNDDRCTMKNNFICKYSDDKPTVPSTRTGGEETEPATPILPEDTEKEDTTEILKESKGNGGSRTPALRSSAPPGRLCSPGTARTWRFTTSYESRAKLIWPRPART
uniref:Layilin n=1 Tax=Ovis aries TaxID=9940 RepID=A0AC11E385_SHEEP